MQTQFTIFACISIYLYIYTYIFFFSQLFESVPSDSNKCPHYLFEHYWSKSCFTVELIKLCIFYASSWRRKWQPTPVFLPEKSHGWSSLVGYSPWGRKKLDTTEQLHFLLTFMCLLGLVEFIDHLAYLVQPLTYNIFKYMLVAAMKGATLHTYIFFIIQLKWYFLYKVFLYSSRQN